MALSSSIKYENAVFTKVSPNIFSRANVVLAHLAVSVAATAANYWKHFAFEKGKYDYEIYWIIVTKKKKAYNFDIILYKLNNRETT